ncbi:hypothetical protein G3I60_42770 [Streptomyces sp. SID13666]|uniref:hypothetical protein n=1 Tax=unclassified Streptomyces TaxID=2593676 RepID=UPI0013C23FEC|nr:MULTISPECIES: hypothetical protein [unclassified Streptomyces]MCZ4098954.1 hypothetical protein [Streptomyces sp. H39-C1]NEA60714.1 hypothetical protein [Streptomyces sp. SID13666]
MVAVDIATATELLSRPLSSKDEAGRRLAYGLARSLAAEGISDDLIDTLEEVLRGWPGPAVPDRKLHAWLVRFGLPLPRRQPPDALPPSYEDAGRIADRFRRATRQLLQIVPHRVAMYPTQEVHLLLALCDEQPGPEGALSYLRRFTLAILAVLDLMGDDT